MSKTYQNSTDPAASRHTRTTRLVHAGLALAVVVQLLSSLGMQHPENGKPGNVLFEVHEYGGLTAFAFILLFWVVVTARKQGTPWGLLFPWFSSARRAALWSDIKHHATALQEKRLPPHDGASPMASAVHGLGMLLITAMAGTGTLYYIFGDDGGFMGVVMGVHESLANLAWAYLIGHASLAVLQHFFTDFHLRSMWSLRHAPKKDS